MFRTLRKLIYKTLCASVVALIPVSVWANQTYPSKPVRIIVPFTAGGPADILARLVGKELGDRWGQSFVIENQPGAGGNIGTANAATQKPDGYTLLLGFVGTHAINPSIYSKLKFDPEKDFVAVSPLSKVTIALLAHPNLGVSSVAELVAMAKAKPGQLTFSSPGTGTPHHLAGELLKHMTSTDMLHIPYKGAIPALTDLLGGRVSFMFSSVPPALSHIQQKSLTVLGVTSLERARIDQAWPTLAEEGLAGYDVENWYGIFAPAGTPSDIVQKINAAIGEVLNLPRIQEALAQQGAEVMQASPEEFQKYVAAERSKWLEVIKSANVEIN